MEEINLNSAVFLDRDGTLIEDCGYISSIKEVKFYLDVVEALSLLTHKYKFFIVTNQGGVGKGIIKQKEADEINSYVVDFLKRKGIIISDVFCCYHKKEDNCKCIKPNPYLLLQASEKYDINLKSSFVIGDHPHDIELANNAGATGIYLLTGHGEEHKNEIPESTIVVENIYEASLKIMDWIFPHENFINLNKGDI